MGSEARCCGGGLSSNCLLIIHFIFQFLATPKSNIFPFSQILNVSPNNYWIKDCDLIESYFRLNEILARYLRKRVEINEK